MQDTQEEAPGALERIRKVASFLSVLLFGVSFVILLALSATTYWHPENEFLTYCDRVWRVSGLSALVLGSIPYVRRFVHTLVGWLGFGPR